MREPAQVGGRNAASVGRPWWEVKYTVAEASAFTRLVPDAQLTAMQ